jgi:hypothetical protein
VRACDGRAELRAGEGLQQNCEQQIQTQCRDSEGHAATHPQPLCVLGGRGGECARANACERERVRERSELKNLCQHPWVREGKCTATTVSSEHKRIQSRRCAPGPPTPLAPHPSGTQASACCTWRDHVKVKPTKKSHARLDFFDKKVIIFTLFQTCSSGCVVRGRVPLGWCCAAVKV